MKCQAMRAVMNKGAEELCKAVYEPKAGDNSIATRKTRMILLVNNCQYIWGYRWSNTQIVDIGERVYVVEKPRLVRHR